MGAKAFAYEKTKKRCVNIDCPLRPASQRIQLEDKISAGDLCDPTEEIHLDDKLDMGVDESQEEVEPTDPEAVDEICILEMAPPDEGKKRVSVDTAPYVT